MKLVQYNNVYNNVLDIPEKGYAILVSKYDNDTIMCKFYDGIMLGGKNKDVLVGNKNVDVKAITKVVA